MVRESPGRLRPEQQLGKLAVQCRRWERPTRSPSVQSCKTGMYCFFLKNPRRMKAATKGPKNPTKLFDHTQQAHDYDPQALYVKNWLPELRPLEDPQVIFQPWKLPEDKKFELKLAGNEWVEQPLKKIEFHVARNGGRGRGGGAGGEGGRGQSRGRGRGGGGGGGGFHGRGRGDKPRGQRRLGGMDKVEAMDGTTAVS